MKLQAELADEKYEVEARREGDRLFAAVDDRKYELEVSEPEPGVFLFKNNGKVTEVFVSPQKNPSDPIDVQTGGRSYSIKLVDPKRLRGSVGSEHHGDGAAEIRTAMPGKVVRILLKAGSPVVKGEGVLIVEAMKMQNELKAPKDGTIKDVRVEEGSTVSAGDVLVVIE
jgi:biotin carboxyl carrier protein